MTRNIRIVAALLLLCGCEPNTPESDIDVSQLHGEGHVQRMFLAVPDVLVVQSTRLNKPLNLNDPEMVAHALGITLTGDKKQVLYVVQMTAPTEHGMAKREIPIRVDNIRDGAKMIREWQSPSL